MAEPTAVDGQVCIYPLVHLIIIHPSIHLSTHLSIHLSVHVYTSMCLSVHPSVHLSPHAPATQFADCGQGSVAVPAQCGKGVETDPCNLVSPDGQWHVRTMPKPAAATAAATTKGATKVSKPSSTSVESVDEVIGGGGDKRRASTESESGSQPKKQLSIRAAFSFSKAQVRRRGPY